MACGQSRRDVFGDLAVNGSACYGLPDSKGNHDMNRCKRNAECIRLRPIPTTPHMVIMALLVHACVFNFLPSIGSADIASPSVAKVISIATSPDGRHFVYGTGGKAVEVREFYSYNLVHRLKTTDPVTNVAYSDDGKIIYTADRSIIAWDALTGEQIRTFDKHIDSGQAISSFAISRDGTKALSGKVDGTATLWNTRSGEAIKVVADELGRVSAVDFHPHKDLFLIASRDRDINLWASDLEDPVHTLEAGNGRFTSAKFSDDGKFIVIGMRGGNVRIWDFEKSELQEKRFDAHSPHDVRSVAFSKTGEFLLTSSPMEVKVWDMSSNALILTIAPIPYLVLDAVFRPGDREIVVGTFLGVKIYEREEGKDITPTNYPLGAGKVVVQP